MKRHSTSFALFSVMAFFFGTQPAWSETKVEFTELSRETEDAITEGHEYLGSCQNDDGSLGGRYKVACTSLSLMAFMLKGYFPKQPPYGEQMEKGVGYLLKRAEQGGGYVGSSMYEHGLATLALSEVWGMSNREELREGLKKAVGVILRSQNPAGGWRYQPRPASADLSVTVVQIIALASAKEAGILVPNVVIQKALKYVKSCQNRFEGGFGYTPRGSPGFARTGAGVMSLLMCGERDSRSIKAGLYYLQKSPDKKFTQARFYYYSHYYCIQAMYQAGDEYYKDWYPKIRDALLKKQQANGSWSGGGGGHPSYGTSMSILILGVPYRFLPIYQR